MERKRRIYLSALISIFVLFACVETKIIMVDEKTQLENQILGSFEQMEKELVLVSSVRDALERADGVAPAQKEALLAMMNRRFNEDDVSQLKALGVFGEGRSGLLYFFENERTKNDAKFRSFARRIMKEENRDRTTIMRRIVSITPNLERGDYHIVEEFMYKLNLAASSPGVRVQNTEGQWVEKANEE